MKSRASEMAVGIFVILFGIAIFFLAMRVSGLVGNTIPDSYNMTATFENVNGIKPRAKVAMSGVTVGQVDTIELDPVTRLATVRITLNGDLTTFNKKQLKEVQKNALEELKYSSDYADASPEQQKVMEKQLLDNMTSITNIDDDAYIMVATNGLLGEKYLKIVPGGGLTYLKRGEQITNTQSTMEIEDLVTKFITGGSGKASDKEDGDSPDTATTDHVSFVE
jgi:phospholipid/cholesterol/gamma-HCH transport system substrate-binding protein